MEKADKRAGRQDGRLKIMMVCKLTEDDLRGTIALVCKDMDGVVPTEIQVIPAGFHQTPKGDFLCDAESAELVIEHFTAQINDMVMDYEHKTLSGEEAPASGWIKKLINKKADGIWAVVEWTEKSKQYIANKEYRYVSPVFLKRVTDNKVVRLINVALTNQPNIDGMIPLINKLQISDEIKMQNKEKEEVMDKELLKLLGLPETATLTEVMVAVNKMKADLAAGTAIVANKAVLEALGLKEGAGESEVVATVMANKQAVTTIEGLTTQVNKLTDQLKTKEVADVEAMVNKAIEGDEKGSKLLPAQKDWALAYAKKDLEGFKIFLNKAPYQVVKGKVAGEQSAEDSAALDATQLQVNKMLSIDTETFKKFGPKVAAMIVVFLLISGLFFGGVGTSFAALSADRDTPSKAGQVFELGVATGVKIYKGALVAVNAGGYATPGATATTLVGLGRADQTVDNTAGSNGDLNVRISRGIFRFANSAAADAIANDDIGKICYIVDDATVALTDGSATRSPAGRIFGIDTSGVWVEFLHFSAPGTIATADIADGAVTNAKVNAAADIAGSKLSPTFAGPAYPLLVVTTSSTAGVVTYSAAEVTGGVILRDPAGGNRSDVTPTAAAIVAVIPDAVVGSAFEFTIRNTADAAETITVTAGAGVTLSGTMTIAQNNSKRFLAICTNVTGAAEAVTIYSLGTVVH